MNKNTFENELNLGDYLSIALFHKKKIVFIVFFGTLISIYSTFVKTPVYKATSTLIYRDKPGSSYVSNFNSDVNKFSMENEIELIKSRVVAKEVVRRFWDSDLKDKLHIFGTRNYYPKGERFRRILKEIFSLGLFTPKIKTFDNIDRPYDESIGEKFAPEILKNIKVSVKRNTDIILITYLSVFPEEARRISEMIAIVYREIERDLGNEDASLSVSFLEKLVKSQEKKLFDAEEEIKQFKIENKMYTLDGNVDQITERLISIETELYNNASEISIRNEKLNFLNSKLSESEKSLAKKISTDMNLQMNNLRSEITTLEFQLIQNTKLHGKEHGAVIELQEKINAMKTELTNKVKDLIEKGISVSDPLEERQESISRLLSLDSELFGLEISREELIKQQNIYKDKLSRLPDMQLKFTRLTRDAEVIKQNFTYIREKLEEARIKLASISGRVQILDIAKKPTRPISPDHNKDIIFGLIISIFFSGLIITIIEFFDVSLKSPNDIKKYGLVILGIIPSIGNYSNQKNSFFKSSKIIGGSGSRNVKRRLITKEDPRSPVSEAYRSLRTSLIYADIDKKTKSILVSSAGPGEGKTTTVANMAITYANLGKKTLLIDTDLRRPVVHKVLDLNKEPGITDYLVRTKIDFESMVQKTDIENLYAVTSGIIPPNPSEILGSKKMTNLIAELEHSWDIILFDSPPLVAVTDATMISKEIDKIIIVVKVGQTDKKAFEHTINSLKNVNSPIGGVVLNAVDNKNSYGSYYYYYQYYNYYASDSKKN